MKVVSLLTGEGLVGQKRAVLFPFEMQPVQRTARPRARSARCETGSWTFWVGVRFQREELGMAFGSGVKVGWVGQCVCESVHEVTKASCSKRYFS